MLRIESVIGHHADAGLHARLHQLEHQGALDVVKISVTNLDRHRLRVTSERGSDIAIALPRHEKLFDGAVLFLDDTRAIVVKAGEQRWLRLSPRSTADAVELGYHAGNLHWRVRFDGNDLLVSLDGPASTYLARIEPLTATGRVTASEECE